MKSIRHQSKKSSSLRRIFFWGLVILITTVIPSCELDPAIDAPQVEVRSEYLGRWEVLEKTGINAPQVYSVQIREGANPNAIYISNLYNISSVEVDAEVSEFSLLIPAQQLEGIRFEGSGEATVNFDQITLNFAANDGSGVDSVQAILSR